MKISIGLILIHLIFVFGSEKEDDWGATGHRVVGKIAAQHLSKKAQRNIDKLLDGATLDYVSNYADDIKSDSRYRAYGPWHYINVESDQDHRTLPTKKEGDIVQAIQRCIAVLKNPEQTKEEKQFHLKLLVHFIGDLHQPMHAGRPGDRGGNDIQLKWFGRSTNLHRLWDSDIIESHGMSYTEMAINMPQLSKAQKKYIQQQSLAIWVEESQALAAKIYEDTPAESRQGYAYRYRYLDTIRMQMLKGGLRLAGVLETIFG